MAAKVNKVVGSEDLSKKLSGLGKGVQGESLATAMKAGGLIILNAIKENLLKQGLVRTRNLSRSIHEEVTEQTETRVVLQVGTNLEYAAIHEYGGTIKAKNGKYLAIPVGSFRDSPRKHPDLKLRKSARDTLMLVDASGVVQYVLKTSVVIPARPYMRPAFDENKNEAMEQVGQVLQQKIREIAEAK